ncbi:hypothetical protein WJX73_004514 [Symbiochloris irregularis]|uniref:Uncharacterized protein n=1 Tax=Symbiochloris irregularis TaxID=706552 RepID=A0AAW1PRX6_9CHLO
MVLRDQKPAVFTNRHCIKKTFDEKGLEYIGQLALENVESLAGVIQWNHENGVRFFRMSSNVFPWATEYKLRELPNFDLIAEKLAFAGKLARAYDQRLTFHPSHFVKLAAAEPKLLAKSIHELEVHSEMLDLMGYAEASPVNKINIHVGGVYGDKEETLKRFAAGFRKLSPRCQKRLTLENDDLCNSFSVADLMGLHREIGVPVVFDFHHWKFCTGDQTQEEALADALSTWPKGIRPVVHWSESQEGRPGHAHSDYIYGPMDLYGRDKDVDVMIEAKCKEQSLLAFRGDIPLPPKFTLPPESAEDHPALQFA